MRIATRTVRFATDGAADGDGKLLDIYVPDRPGDRCVLLWHGLGPDERDILAPLAREIARLGVTVLVPDWRSDRPDGGREHLTDALRFGRDYARDGVDGVRQLVL
ncbi:hypothetical protein P8605_34175, partial [Streptomyces sp. T-3]|nr:hypothetical protein [Streptomyces sp. T-3]